MIDYISPDEVGLEEGVFLVKLARKAVELYLNNNVVMEPPADTPQKLMKRSMSFVTILKLIGGTPELRGCIGYLKPIEPLALNVIHAAISAATQDPRFPPMQPHELNNVIFEVSVLSMQERLHGRGRELLKQFTIGRDGLVVEYRIYKGLLLPEVPVEYCWDNETFISETCVKAGMSPDCWLSDRVSVFRFYARTFRELSPQGRVVLRDLRKEYEESCLPR